MRQAVSIVDTAKQENERGLFDLVVRFNEGLDEEIALLCQSVSRFKTPSRVFCYARYVERFDHMITSVFESKLNSEAPVQFMVYNKTGDIVESDNNTMMIVAVTKDTFCTETKLVFVDVIFEAKV